MAGAVKRRLGSVYGLCGVQPSFPAGALTPLALVAAMQLCGLPDAVVQAVAQALLRPPWPTAGVTRQSVASLLDPVAPDLDVTTVNNVKRRLLVRAFGC